MGDSGRFDVICVGTSFATSFFLHEYLRRAPAGARVLVLERGAMETHAQQIEQRSQTKRGVSRRDWAESYDNKNPDKPWTITLRFGGNSNCWTAMTPRLTPDDFRMRTAYGVGDDWPIRYEDLEPFYAEAEGVMRIAGPQGGSPYPRGGPHPQPPHRLSRPEEILKAAFPDQFFHAPTARPTEATPSRPRCCASLSCKLCPIDAKFSVLNEMMHLYRDARVTLELGARAQQIDIAGSQATGVVYAKDGRVVTAKGSLVVLGANAVFNPHLLLRSGLGDPEIGRGLMDHAAMDVSIMLRGVDGLQGSTTVTGHGYMLYGGPRRRDRAGAMIETRSTIMDVRDERGRWRQWLGMRVVFEDLRQPTNCVTTSADPDVPAVVYGGVSPYTRRAMDALAKDLEPVLAALPVESVHILPKPVSTLHHILGTTPMGDDPARSVVDKHLVHHKVRNLVVLGSGAFVTSSPANPTLTLSALSLWSARRLFGPT